MDKLFFLEVFLGLCMDTHTPTTSTHRADTSRKKGERQYWLEIENESLLHEQKHSDLVCNLKTFGVFWRVFAASVLIRAASVMQWFSAVDFRRRRWGLAVGSSPIHGRWHAVQRPLISPRLLANAH